MLLPTPLLDNTRNRTSYWSNQEIGFAISLLFSPSTMKEDKRGVETLLDEPVLEAQYIEVRIPWKPRGFGTVIWGLEGCRNSSQYRIYLSLHGFETWIWSYGGEVGGEGWWLKCESDGNWPWEWQWDGSNHDTHAKYHHMALSSQPWFITKYKQVFRPASEPHI